MKSFEQKTHEQFQIKFLDQFQVFISPIILDRDAYAFNATAGRGGDGDLHRFSSHFLHLKYLGTTVKLVSKATTFSFRFMHCPPSLFYRSLILADSRPLFHL